MLGEKRPTIDGQSHTTLTHNSTNKPDNTLHADDEGSVHNGGADYNPPSSDPVFLTEVATDLPQASDSPDPTREKLVHSISPLVEKEEDIRSITSTKSADGRAESAEGSVQSDDNPAPPLDSIDGSDGSDGDNGQTQDSPQSAHRQTSSAELDQKKKSEELE